MTHDDVVMMRRQHQKLIKRISKIRMLLVNKASVQIQDDACSLWLKDLDLAASRMQTTIKQMEEEVETHECVPLNQRLSDKGYSVIRSEVYGSIFEALNRIDGIDGALRVLGHKSLLDQFYAEAWGL